LSLYTFQQKIAIQLAQTDALLNKYIEILYRSEDVARLIFDEEWQGAEAVSTVLYIVYNLLSICTQDEEEIERERAEAVERARREEEERKLALQREKERREREERERKEKEERERLEQEKRERLAARGGSRGTRRAVGTRGVGRITRGAAGGSRQGASPQPAGV
jgi:septal ring factor EnvC (AmiA/AmiB activator)